MLYLGILTPYILATWSPPKGCLLSARVQLGSPRACRAQGATQMVRQACFKGARGPLGGSPEDCEGRGPKARPRRPSGWGLGQLHQGGAGAAEVSTKATGRPSILPYS